MDLDTDEIDGACHCGTVRFRVSLTNGLRTARRCTCSYCRMRGAVAVSAGVDGVRILAGADALTTYRFNTNAVPHYFCSICGIYTHHQRRSDSTQCGVNVACLAGISPFDFPALPVNDGVDHPADAGRSAGTRIAGHLRYVPSDPGNAADRQRSESE